MEFVAIDFETTGYEDGNVNEPWQLGAVVVRDWEIVELKEWFFGTKLDQSKPTIIESFEDWAPLLTGRRLVAHNIATERTILTRVAPLTDWGPWSDTMKLAKARYPRMKSFALGELCEAFGCVPQMPERTWHDALFDALACAHLAHRLAALPPF